MAARLKSDSQKESFTTRLDGEKIKAIKHLAVDERKPIGDLLGEAIDLLLNSEKYRKEK
jgi:hypothetical protein